MPHSKYTCTTRPAIMPVGPSIAYIELTRGQHTLVDAEHALNLAANKWCALLDIRANSYYAVRRVTVTSHPHKQISIRMHRCILMPSDGLTIDHVNGNTLDNRLANLRLATNTQQNANQVLNKRNTSGVKGVRPFKTPGKWHAQIRHNGRSVHLGVFSSKEEAAQAYASAAVTIHGEFAMLKPSRG